MDRSTKQKINKETQTLKDTINQLDLIDIYRTFHPKTMSITFFSSAHGTFSRIDHILGHKYSLSPCLFNFYAEYFMRNAGLEETQAGIKNVGRNINNLR